MILTNNVSVTGANHIENFRKIIERRLIGGVTRLEIDHFQETLLIPVVQQLHRRSPPQIVRQKTQFFHDIGQTDRKLLPMRWKKGRGECGATPLLVGFI